MKNAKRLLCALVLMVWALSSATAEVRVGGGGTGCSRWVEDASCMDACYFMSQECPQGFMTCYEDCIHTYNCRYITCI
jgi:hypothetical protein